MVNTIAALLVLAAGFYLLGLGIAAIAAPGPAIRFLFAFAGSARVHFLEITLRIIAGVALVVHSPRMMFAELFRNFGTLLIGTSLVLAVLPWRWHRRFAA